MTTPTKSVYWYRFTGKVEAMTDASVLRISEASSLALHTTVLMAGEPGKRLSAGEMASRLKVSRAHLEKVLQRLAKAGLVEAVRGRGGGFVLRRAPEKVALLTVYEAIEGKLPKSKCLMGKPVCEGKYCLLGGLLGTVDTWFRAYLSGTKLSDLRKVYGGSDGNA